MKNDHKEILLLIYFKRLAQKYVNKNIVYKYYFRNHLFSCIYLFGWKLKKYVLYCCQTKTFIVNKSIIYFDLKFLYLFCIAF